MLGQELKGPNKDYVLSYYEGLKIANKDTKTIGRQLRELRFIVGALGKKDAKAATEDDIKKVVLAILDSKMAAISKRTQ